MESYIILLTTAHNKLMVIGNDKGKPFTSLKTAERFAEKYNESTFNVDAVVLRVVAMSVANAPIAAGKV